MDYITTMVDFQPIIVGAGCLALGYVYGRHCRSLSEMQESAPNVSEEACCQSQSSSRKELQPCQCRSPAPVAIETTTAGKQNSRCVKESETVDEAEIGVEKQERCTKRDLAQLVDVLDRHACNMEELAETVAEALVSSHEQLSNTIVDERDQIILGKKEEKVRLQTPYKKQKSTPPSNRTSSWKGKVEMGSTESNVERLGDGEPPWSREVLNHRIEYFNKVGSEQDEPEQASKLVPCKKKNSILLTSEESPDSTGVRRSTSGLGALATPQLEDTCISPRQDRNIQTGSNLKEERDFDLQSMDFESDKAKERSEVAPSLDDDEYMAAEPVVGNLEDISLDVVRDEDTGTRYEWRQPTVCGDHMDVKEGMACQSEETLEDVPLRSVLETEVFTSAEWRLPTSPVVEHGEDRCFEENDLRTGAPVDKVLKAEIYELLNDADCGKVTFEEIISLLEEKLHMDLREDKTRILALVREVLSISKLLEEERTLEEQQEVK